MKNKYKHKIIIYLTCLLLIASCQGLEDTFDGKKKNNSDEFLVEKKNPLVLPPEFDTLPEPEFTKANKGNNEENALKKIIGSETTKVKSSTNTNTNSTLEKSILEKIK